LLFLHNKNKNGKPVPLSQLQFLWFAHQLDLLCNVTICGSSCHLLCLYNSLFSVVIPHLVPLLSHKVTRYLKQAGL